MTHATASPVSSLDNARQALASLIAAYQQLDESQKFELGRTFNQETGGKLSPYNSPQPVAVAIIPVFDETAQEVRVLVARRAIAPRIGELALPGGFVEHHEHPQDAVSREIREELGLDLPASKFQLFHTPLTSPSNNTLIFFRYTEVLRLTVEAVESAMQTAECGHENSEVVFADDATPLAFEYHAQAMRAFLATVRAFLERGIGRR